MPKMLRQDVLEGLAPVAPWNPGPMSPWAGLDAHGWKTTGDLWGYEPQGPTQRDLDLIRHLGPIMNRRRFPPEMREKAGLEW